MLRNLSQSPSFEYKLSLDIPFENSRQASIARDTLLPDPILKADMLNVTFSVDGFRLRCDFEGVDDRVLRVAVSNTIDNIKTIIECMDQFDGQEDTLFS